ncbi:hypothetical protein ISN45_At01g034440 [Arabidopsis thaliana x Arabidopsis arenosa]|uniref:Uncharacterized protein n=2 Tax=Arabidopsis TaxID=3701 RepID=A0A178WLA3_ARATH|nr:hypothetical protein ISN45_At01g034440 [Arabidopsis thaliana x Arabidopsis arenosa]OAP19078.1 hypothetical protein AXX17_AT1G35630 [Arabidopsis thaliana]
MKTRRQRLKSNMPQASSWCVKGTSANDSRRLQVVTIDISCDNDVEKDSFTSTVAGTNRDEVVRSLGWLLTLQVGNHVKFEKRVLSISKEGSESFAKEEHCCTIRFLYHKCIQLF